MSDQDDDMFVREVNESLREDRLQALWKRYGIYLISGAALAILGTSAQVGWTAWSENQSARSGDSYAEAQSLLRGGDSPEAISILESLSAEGGGQYPALARMRLAAEKAKSGEAKEAIAEYDSIASESNYPESLRIVSRLRAGYLAVDAESRSQVEARLSPLASPESAWRSLAREALALSALKEGSTKDAASLFRQIADDSEAGGAVRGRAGLMLDFLAGEGEDVGNR